MARLSASGGVAVVVVVVGFVLAVGVFEAAHRPLSWAAASIVVAVVADPLIDRLQPYIRRFPAVLLVFLTAGAAVVGLLYVTFDDLDQAVGRIETAAPEAAATIEERDDRIGQVSRDLGLVDRVESAVDGLRDRVGSGEDVIKSTALLAPAYLVGAVFTVFLMSYGPRIGSAALDQLPASRRPRVAQVLTRSATRSRKALLLTLADAVVIGLLVALTAALLDLPAPSALGVFAGLLAILPHVGIVLGAVPLLLLALGLESGIAAGLIGLGAVALQLADSLVLRRRVDRWIQLGLLTPWVVVLLGYDVYGVGAAVYGLAYAIFGLAVLDELAVDDAPSDGDTPGALAASAA